MTLLSLIERFTSDVVSESQLHKLLTQSKAEKISLRVKFGIDPTFTDVHLGHAVPIRLLRTFQTYGHFPVLIIGDATARLGDPTGRNEQRPPLTLEQVRENAKTYLQQIGRVLDLDPAVCEIRYNSEWFDKMSFFDCLELASRGTVARLLERDDFKKRVDSNQGVHLHEMLYPLMQGYDSVQVKADIELGGNDQLFNLHMGRQMQERAGLPPQICITTPLLLGTDGRKMSKTYGNHVALNASPDEMYGKVMSISDESMEPWFMLVTDIAEGEIKATLSGHPRKAKGVLAADVVRQIYGEKAAEEAAEEFLNRFSRKELPKEIETFCAGVSPIPIANLLKESGLASSTSEARRLIKSNAVRLDGELVADPTQELCLDDKVQLIQVGKRRVIQVKY